MRLFILVDKINGARVSGLSLLGLVRMTDFSSEEFDRIADIAPGARFNLDLDGNKYVQRMETKARKKALAQRIAR